MEARTHRCSSEHTSEESYPFSRSTCWGSVASLLCDSTIVAITNFRAWQMFEVVHPKFGALKLLLCAVDDCAILFKDERLLDLMPGSDARPVRLASAA